MKALPGLILVMSVTREGRMTESVNRRKKKIYKGWCNLIPPITIREHVGHIALLRKLRNCNFPREGQLDSR